MMFQRPLHFDFFPQDLLLALCEEFELECCANLAQAITRHVNDAKAIRERGGEEWWKLHEAAWTRFEERPPPRLSAVSSRPISRNLASSHQEERSRVHASRVGRTSGRSWKAYEKESLKQMLVSRAAKVW